MRNFVAACCCLIVGLEILIGVPIAICLGFMLFGSELVTNAYVVETPVAGPVYAVPFSTPLPSDLPPPLPCTVSGQPSSTFDPYGSAPPSGLVCPAPATALPTAPTTEPTTAPTFSPSAPQLAAESATSVPPSALASVHDLLPPVPDAGPIDSTSAPQLIAAGSEWRELVGAGRRLWFTVGDANQFLARVCSAEGGPEAQPGDKATAAASDEALQASIRQTTELLYRQANCREEEGDFGSADQLRQLARDLRDEDNRVSLRRQQRQPEPNQPQLQPSSF